MAQEESPELRTHSSSRTYHLTGAERRYGALVGCRTQLPQPSQSRAVAIVLFGPIDETTACKRFTLAAVAVTPLVDTAVQDPAVTRPMDVTISKASGAVHLPLDDLRHPFAFGEPALTLEPIDDDLGGSRVCRRPPDRAPGRQRAEALHGEGPVRTAPPRFVQSGYPSR